ncbi:hypothetical protein IKG02_01225 [Candidatus Saccharibacteria bacterium]|nr:hypothetical protein [Candidatus Saccharibacteria bacterium]
MQKLKTKLRRVYYRLRHYYFSADNVIFLLTIVLCVVWTGSSISAMSRNWELSQKIATKSRELERLDLEVKTIELENIYYASEEYQELSARSKENKKLPGENLVYLSENSETAKNKYKEAPEAEKIEEPSNFSQWMSFLFNA